MMGLQQFFLTHYSVHPPPTGHRVEKKECQSWESPPEEMRFREVECANQGCMGGWWHSEDKLPGWGAFRPQAVESGPDAGVPQLQLQCKGR